MEGFLEADPRVGGDAEGLLETDGEVGGDWRFAGANGGHRRFFDLQVRPRFGHRQAQRFDAVLPNRLAGVTRVAARHR